MAGFWKIPYDRVSKIPYDRVSKIPYDRPCPGSGGEAARQVRTHTTAPQVAPTPSRSQPICHPRDPPARQWDPARGDVPQTGSEYTGACGEFVPQTGSEYTGACGGAAPEFHVPALVPPAPESGVEFRHARYAVKCHSQMYPYRIPSTLHFLMTSAFWLHLRVISRFDSMVERLFRRILTPKSIPQYCKSLPRNFPVNVELWMGATGTGP